MGLFSFGKKKISTFNSPVIGKVVDLSKVQDPVFAEKMMGDGIAIDPAEGVVYAPCDAEIINVFHTKHAIGLKTDTGYEVLIHFGLDTVNLKGEGFTSHVEASDKVKSGQKLITIDLDNVKKKVPSVVTPIVVTNLNGKAIKFIAKDGDDVNANTALFELE